MSAAPLPSPASPANAEAANARDAALTTPAFGFDTQPYTRLPAPLGNPATDLHIARRRAIAAVFITIATAVWAGLLGAQAPPPEPRLVVPTAVVTSIQINRENVFDKAELERWLARAMNGLHITTREAVVARELLFTPGEPYDSIQAAETARNLRKLDVFRDVTVDSVRTDSGVMARVTTRDSWTTQISASFKSGGDQITWGIGLKEKNLLGLGIKAGVKYTDDPDRSTTSFNMTLPRVWRNRLDVSGSYDLLSDGEKGRISIGAPFNSLITPWSATFDGVYDDIDVLRFFEGEEVASDTVRRLLSTLTMRGAWARHATKTGYRRTGVAVRFRRDDFADSLIADADRSFFGDLEVNIEVSQSQYSVIRGYRGLGGPEDVDLSRTIRAGLWVAPKALGYERTGFGPALTVHAGKAFRGGFTYLDGRASSLFTGSGLDSGTVAGGGALALQPKPRHSMLVSASGGMAKNPHPGAEFDLGLTFGPRGFPAHSFTGDRAFFTTAEYKWTAWPDVIGLFAVGFAAFGDYGGAWYNGSPRRTGGDAGFGLRLGSTRGSASKGATRIDLAHRFANDALGAAWVLAIGSGFPFDRPR